jgi:SAM-dependent methyltransferase/Flp pilus assembly protein TadD
MPLPSAESVAAKAHLLPLLRAAMSAANERRFDEAERLVASILAQDPDLADAVHMQAYIALHRGQLRQAADLARRAIALDFHYESYHMTLGQALQGMGDLDGARDCFGIALGLNPKNVNAYVALATIHVSRYDYAAARAVLRQGKLVDANNPELRFLLGHIALTLGERDKALNALHMALQAQPDNPRYQAMYGRALRGVKLKQPNPVLIDTLLPLLGHSAIQPLDVLGVVESALLMHPDIVALESAPGKPPEVLAAFMNTPAFPRLSENSLLLRWLQHGLLTDPHLEAVVIALRRAALWLGLGKPTALAPHVHWLAALSQRNFHAEYLDTETPEERNLLLQLDANITEAVAGGKLPSAAHMALYACYRPLNKRPDAKALARLQWPLEVAALRRSQLDEPLREREIAADLPLVTPIEDATSKHVREMYEESPFPRWSQPVLGFGYSVAHVVGAALPRQALPDIKADNPSVLVAGCGTGLHAILAATTYANAQVLALDLSRASLAYGKRKAEELGYSNIRFGQADILKLGALEQRFDVIECFGVLHHMHDPAAGLAQLAMLLKPGGYMMLGLYSEVGRRDVVASRELIALHGYRDTPDDIRRFRSDVNRLDPALAQRLRRHITFQTLPDFRDLVFHRQEHRYYPEQLGPLVASAGLRFLGFEFSEPKMLREYLAAYPDDDKAVNLANWAEFERDHPDLFANCFRFWVDKPL